MNDFFLGGGRGRYEGLVQLKNNLLFWAHRTIITCFTNRNCAAPIIMLLPQYNSNIGTLSILGVMARWHYEGGDIRHLDMPDIDCSDAFWL